MSNQKSKGLKLIIRGFRDDPHAYIEAKTDINFIDYQKDHSCLDQIIKEEIVKHFSFVVSRSGMRTKPDPENIIEIGFWINNIGIGDRKISIKYIDNNGSEGFTSLSYECN